MRSVDSKFYKSMKWRRCANDYLDSVNRLCELCIAENKITPAKIVHHKVHMNEYTVQDESFAYGFENLQAVCLDCHNKIHFGNKVEKRYTVVDGNLIIIGEGDAPHANP